MEVSPSGIQPEFCDGAAYSLDDARDIGDFLIMDFSKGWMVPVL